MLCRTRKWKAWVLKIKHKKSVMNIQIYNADIYSVLSVLILQRIIDIVIFHNCIPHVQHMWSTYTINTCNISY